MHGFKRSHKDIIQVVRVCEMTLRKRLVEFEKTPSGDLTAEDFETVDLEDECDPPAFTQAKLQRVKEEPSESKENTPMKKEKVSQRLPEDEEGEDEEVIPEALNIEETDVHDAEEEAKAMETGIASQSQMEPLLSDTQITPVTTLQSENKEVITTIPAYNPHLIDLSPLEDDEVLGCLHSAEEVKSKTELWDQLNRDFEEKQQERKRLEAEGLLQPKVHFTINFSQNFPIEKTKTFV